MIDPKDGVVLDALANAAKLYDRYLELSRLAELGNLTPTVADATESLPRPESWDHPLGLVITAS